MTWITYRDENEIRRVVERFERCDFALPEFTHARHLTVACWYLCTLSREEAMERMRRGGSDLGVSTGRLKPLSCQTRRVASVDDVMGYAWMIRIF